MSTVKTKEERQKVVDHVLMKLKDCGVEDNFQLSASAAVRELKTLLQAYVDNPDDQAGFSGKIKFPELNTHFVYLLPMRGTTQAYVELVDPRPKPDAPRSGFRRIGKKQAEAKAAKAAAAKAKAAPKPA